MGVEMKNQTEFLTMEQKRDLALQGKAIPMRIKKSGEKNSYIAKLRGTIFDGSLKKKRLGI